MAARRSGHLGQPLHLAPGDTVRIQHARSRHAPQHRDRRARGGDGVVKTAVALTCMVAAWLAAAPIASGQTDGYPSRPITLLVPFPPGGSADVVIRPVAAKVAEALKQPI